MKLRIFLIIASFSCAAIVNAQEVYDVANIPAGLLNKSTAVVRNEEQNLVIKNQTSATLIYKKAITILSKSGEDNAEMLEYYDNFSSVYNLKAVMYDAKGVKIRSYKTADFKDESIISEGTMFDAYRMKKLAFLNATFPYTIEYSYEKSYTGYIAFPDWRPVSSYDCAIEKSVYTLQIPKTITFRFLKSQILKTDSTVINDKTIYKWSCQNLPSFEYEPMSTGLKAITPWVMVAPNDFEYDNSR